MTSVGPQTAAEAQSVSAPAEEQTASLTEMSDSAESLADQATSLSSLLDAFELGSGSGGVDAGRAAATDGGRQR